MYRSQPNQSKQYDEIQQDSNRSLAQRPHNKSRNQGQLSNHGANGQKNPNIKTTYKSINYQITKELIYEEREIVILKGKENIKSSTTMTKDELKLFKKFKQTKQHQYLQQKSQMSPLEISGKIKEDWLKYGKQNAYKMKKIKEDKQNQEKMMKQSQINTQSQTDSQGNQPLNFDSRQCANNTVKRDDENTVDSQIKTRKKQGMFKVNQKNK